eukprot:146107-Karenia_brevis.AAC.1
MSFPGKGAGGSAGERAEWAKNLIPKSGRADAAKTSAEQAAWAAANHQCGGSDREMFQYLATRKVEGQPNMIPLPKFPPLTAPGPT